MTDTTGFVTVMTALSGSVQTLVDHVVKRRIKWLDTPTPDNPANERRRQSAVHLASAILGAVIAASLKLAPLSYLGLPADLAQSSVLNVLAAGVIVSFGGSFLNEVLGAVREFKDAQQSVASLTGGASGGAPEAPPAGAAPGK